MDLALTNLQSLICHKIQPNNQPTKIYFIYISIYSFIYSYILFFFIYDTQLK